MSEIKRDSKGRFMKGHKECSGIDNPFYGKTHTYKTRSIMVKNHKGRTGMPQNEYTKLKISKSLKGRISPMLGKHHSNKSKIKIRSSNLGLKRSPETRERKRIDRQTQILKNGVNINIGKHEKQYLDFIEDAIGLPIIRQYSVKGYWLDGYCKERNIAFEIDEKQHNPIKDKIREDIIKKELNCSFVRIKDYG